MKEEKVGVKPTPRRKGRKAEKPVYVCQLCKEPLSTDTRLSPRSNVWAFGLAGTRFVFCSPEHRDTHDAKARAALIDKEE